MTTPNELVTAEQAREHIRSLSLLPEIDKTQIVRIAESAFRTVIALHEAHTAANARADAAEARAAVMRGLLHAALTTRAMDDLEWQLDARAALETGAGDE